MSVLSQSYYESDVTITFLRAFPTAGKQLAKIWYEETTSLSPYALLASSIWYGTCPKEYLIRTRCVAATLIETLASLSERARRHIIERVLDDVTKWDITQQRSRRSDETSHLKTDVNVRRDNAWWDLAWPLAAAAAVAAGRPRCLLLHRGHDECGFVATAAGATVIHTTLCHQPLGSVRLSGRAAAGRMDAGA